MTLQTGGNIGIGTTAPAAKLQLNPGTGTEGLRILSSNFSPFVVRNTADTADLFRIDQNGNVTGGNIPSGAGMGYDEATYFAPQAQFEAGSFPFTILAGVTPSFATVNNTNVPFSKVATSTVLTEFASDFIPVQPGDTLYGEIWAMRETGSVGNAG